MKKLLFIISIFFIGINYVYANDLVTLSKCVDGDTIKILLEDKEYTVRMLAVDTPESVHPTKGVEYYGKEASDYTCNLVTNAKKIELEYDDNSDKTDKYDRLLAWVFVDGELLQEKLIEGGYAKIAYLYDDFKYTSILQEKQELTSAKNLGIWDEDARKKYNEENGKETTSKENNDYSTLDIVIIVVLLLTVIFISDKSIKKKAKKKLKTYLK